MILFILRPHIVKMVLTPFWSADNSKKIKPTNINMLSWSNISESKNPVTHPEYEASQALLGGQWLRK